MVRTKSCRGQDRVALLLDRNLGCYLLRCLMLAQAVQNVDLLHLNRHNLFRFLSIRELIQCIAKI